MNKTYDKKGFLEAILGKIGIKGERATVLDIEAIREKLIDSLVYNSLFNEDASIKSASRWLIREIGYNLGIIPSSIYPFYAEKGEGKFPNITVPAVNIRGLTYDTARAVFSASKIANSFLFIFEIARSEMEYTEQPGDEYATSIIAAGIKEGINFPIFIQGDHFQIRRKIPQDIENVKALIKDVIDAGFYNIDLDTSVLVDLSQPNVYEQQRNNFTSAAELTEYIRKIEPKGITVSLGGEIGEIGGKNSTEEELREYMRGYLEEIKKRVINIGISKMAVQTGTVHGGIPLPSGGVADVKLDFNTLDVLSRVSKEYKLAGTVQHGASTLPLELFNKFPETDVCEVHLATEFQNMVYNLIPDDLREKIYSYLKEACKKEMKETETETQFLYKTRKKGFGPFKKEFFELGEDIKKNIREKLSEKFLEIFKLLKVDNTDKITSLFKPLYYPKPFPEILIGF
ncbi:MAG: class II fructose-bisphosphate aldolase [bacterium]